MRRLFGRSRPITSTAAGSIAISFIIICLSLLGGGRFALAESLEDLGRIAGGLPQSLGYGISSDGSVVVGVTLNVGENDEAFRWTQAGGMIGLGTLGGANSDARSANSDGSVVVGLSTNGAGNDEAYRWTQAGGMIGLGTLGGTYSDAYGVNSDGSVIVGMSVNGVGNEEAYRWTAGGMVGLGTLGGADSYSNSVNPDGSVVIGLSVNGGGLDEAFRWTQAGGMVGLGTLTGGTDSTANGVNDDGSVIVGIGVNAAGNDEAFRWTQADGMTGLGTLGGLSSQAEAVNSDGSVVVGRARNTSGVLEGFRWTELGMQSLNTLLESCGVDMTGITVHEATGISADGETIIGNGYNASGFIAAFIIRDACITTAADLNSSLSQLSSVASDVSYMAMGTMRALMNQADHLREANTTKMWIVGSGLSDLALSGEDLGAETGFGATWHLANGLSAGGGIFIAKRSIELSYDGNQKTFLVGPGAFVAYAPEETGIRAKLGAFGELVELDLTRGYSSGAGTASSDGSTSGSVFGLNAHLGWVYPVADKVALQPFAQYEVQVSSLDSYTETGGPFPAHFDARRNTMTKSRLGCELSYAHSEILELWSWAVWSHRFQNTGPSMDGYLVGLNKFNYGGGPVDTNWGDIGLGAKWKATENVDAFSRITVAVDNQHYAAPDLALNMGVAWNF